MSNLPITKHACTLTEAGESRLLRAALASEFLAEVLSACSASSLTTVSSDGAAAIFACLADQLESVVLETSTMKGNHNDQ